MWRATGRLLKLSHHGSSSARGIRHKVSGRLVISEEVSEALASKSPVVALESTIITHGMPCPDNVQTAQRVESAVRAAGAVPATVGILDGSVHVGLGAAEVERLAQAKNVVKTSRRDMAMVVSQGLCGGTTVSGTMVAAHAAGIPVFVTGGIGGVHRGAEDSMDVSADLTELGRTPVTVVCAGVKSILDIGRTLEYLETEGVPVIKYGSDMSMPAFFTPTSPYTTPYNVQTPAEAAKCIAASRALDLDSGMVIAVPIPAELAARGAVIDEAIQTALREASEQKILGRDVTPYVLKRVNELTRGQSLQANIGLVLNNAKIGGQIAKALSEIEQTTPPENHKVHKIGTVEFRPQNHGTVDEKKKVKERRPVVIGGSMVDFVVKLKTADYELNGCTYPGGVRQLFGGVGRNVADCLARLDTDPLFITALGQDRQGQMVMEYFSDRMDVRGMRQLRDASTGSYVATIEQDGQVLLGVGDMDIHGRITPDLVGEFESDLEEASIVCMDGNLPPETIKYVTKLCNRAQVPVLFEPTDMSKAKKIWTSGQVTYTSPNLGELLAMYDAISGAKTAEDLKALSHAPVERLLAYITDLAVVVAERVPNLLISLGPAGLLVTRRARDHADMFTSRDKLSEDTSHVVAVHYPTIPDIPVLSVSGAGDCMVGAMVAAILRHHPPDIVCKAGLKCAHQSLASYFTVPPEMTSRDYTPEAVAKWAGRMEGHVVPVNGRGKSQTARTWK